MMLEIICLSKSGRSTEEPTSLFRMKLPVGDFIGVGVGLKRLGFSPIAL
jgi:hypothetical protein